MIVCLVRADHREVLALVRDLARVLEEFRDERHPERVAGQQRHGADLARSDPDMELANTHADRVLVDETF